MDEGLGTKSSWGCAQNLSGWGMGQNVDETHAAQGLGRDETRKGDEAAETDATLDGNGPLGRPEDVDQDLGWEELERRALEAGSYDADEIDIEARHRMCIEVNWCYSQEEYSPSPPDPELIFFNQHGYV